MSTVDATTSVRELSTAMQGWPRGCFMAVPFEMDVVCEDEEETHHDFSVGATRSDRELSIAMQGWPRG